MAEEEKPRPAAPPPPGALGLAESYRSLAENNPRDKYVLHSLLMAYLSSKQFADGIKEFGKLANVAPEVAQIRLALGVLYEKYQRGDDAIPHYVRALELDPGEELTYRFLSTRYLIRGDNQNAIKVARAGIERFPRGELLHFNLGYALSRLGQFDEAIANFEKEIQVNPQCSEAYSNIQAVRHNKAVSLHKKSFS